MHIMCSPMGGWCGQMMNSISEYGRMFQHGLHGLAGSNFFSDTLFQKRYPRYAAPLLKSGQNLTFPWARAANMAGSGIFCLWWRFLFSIFGRQGDPGYCNNWQIWPYREIFFFHSCQKASCPFIQPTHNNDQPHNWFNRCQREMTGMWAQLPNSEGVASMWKNPSLRKTAAWGSHESGSLGVPRRKTGSATGTA